VNRRVWSDPLLLRKIFLTQYRSFRVTLRSIQLNPFQTPQAVQWLKAYALGCAEASSFIVSSLRQLLSILMTIRHCATELSLVAAGSLHSLYHSLVQFPLQFITFKATNGMEGGWLCALVATLPEFHKFMELPPPSLRLRMPIAAALANASSALREGRCGSLVSQQSGRSTPASQANSPRLHAQGVPRGPVVQWTPPAQGLLVEPPSTQALLCRLPTEVQALIRLQLHRPGPNGTSANAGRRE